MRLFGPTCTVLVSTLAGCSLFYNPNNLPDQKIDAAPVIDAAPPDVPPDMPTDTNVDMPIFMSVGPQILLEGQGTGGSRPAILAIVGGNFGPDAVVAIEPTAGPDATILINVDNANIVRSPSGTALAVPVTLPVDAKHGSPTASNVPLTIAVTQMGASQPITLKITDQVTLRNLPELTAPITVTTAQPLLYSQVKLAVPAAITFAAAPAAAPAVIRAVGSIELDDVHADASAGVPGPGGGAGGSTTPGNGGGVGGGRAAVLLAGASGGGYGAAGGLGAPLPLGTANPGGVVSGDDQITRYMTNTSGGGGGGGVVGGGGGGTLEITAGGTLSLGKVSANGAASSSAGGGSGGAIVLRAGAAATFKDTITATGGVGGNGGGSGGLGRLRVDVPAQTGAGVMTAVKHAGVAFDVAGNPLVTTDAHQHLRVISEAASTAWTVSILDAAGTTTSSSTITFGSSSASITPTLTFGYNRVCVSPPMGNPTVAESTNCIDLAYVP